MRNVPKAMAPWLAQILPPVWSTLTSSAAKYVKEVVNQAGDEEEVVDSDGEVIGFENLVFAIFEFVQALVETPKFRGSVKAGLSELMYYIVLYMQITEEQVSPSQFELMSILHHKHEWNNLENMLRFVRQDWKLK